MWWRETQEERMMVCVKETIVDRKMWADVSLEKTNEHVSKQ
jgi:hypothetical protein